MRIELLKALQDLRVDLIFLGVCHGGAFLFAVVCNRVVVNLQLYNTFFNDTEAIKNFCSNLKRNREMEVAL